MTTMETLEPGIYRRRDSRTGKLLAPLWVHYPGPDGRTVREAVKPRTTEVRKARTFRAARIAAAEKGENPHHTERVEVAELLDAVKLEYETKGWTSLASAMSSMKVLREVFGTIRAVRLTADLVQARQRQWQQAGLTNATINRRCNLLRHAFALGRKMGKLTTVPYIPRLEEQSARGRYITAADAEALTRALPAHLRDLFRFAYLNGIRKGQLARTLRRYVDLDRGVIAWPPSECKHKEAHTIPLEGETLDLVRRLLTKPPLHCPYLFHGRACAPGHTPTKLYGCLGDFQRRWNATCNRLGLPVGRKVGGFVFHHTRNTAATNLRAGGLEEADAMKITGHQTAQVFRRYDLGNVDVLRDRLAQARAWATQPKVTALRSDGTAG